MSKTLKALILANWKPIRAAFELKKLQNILFHLIHAIWATGSCAGSKYFRDRNSDSACTKQLTSIPARFRLSGTFSSLWRSVLSCRGNLLRKPTRLRWPIGSSFHILPLPLIFALPFSLQTESLSYAILLTTDESQSSSILSKVVNLFSSVLNFVVI